MSLVRILGGGLVIASLVLATACVDRLPDQDRRIVQTPPVSKISVDLLWKEYQSDEAAADRQFWGKAIEVSGKVKTVEAEPEVKLTFAQETPHGVDAFLLDDTAAEIVKAVEPGGRVTLRCFCAGLSGENVVLRSCIRP